MEKIIKIPYVLSQDFDTYDYLAKLQNLIIDCPENRIILDFQNCNFSHAIFTAFIGSLAVWASNFNKDLVYRARKDSNIYKYFKHSGLYSYITGDSIDYTNGNTIPFRRIDMDDSKIINYIDTILNLAPIQLTDSAKELLFKNIYEIFNNSVEHSDAQKGVYSCGHWMPKKKELVFSVYDTGIGIPALVKSKISTEFTSSQAIDWALTKGNSTKQLKNGIPRGIGLSDLKDFIKLNKGSFSIISNDIYYSYDQTDIYQTLGNPIIGTMLSFIIRNDEDHIYFAK